MGHLSPVMRRSFHLPGESRLGPTAVVSRFQMTHQKTLLEPLENIEELLELHDGGFETLTGLILVKCCGVKAQERKRDCCCYGDVTWAEQSKQRGYFPLLSL